MRRKTTRPLLLQVSCASQSSRPVSRLSKTRPSLPSTKRDLPSRGLVRVKRSWSVSPFSANLAQTTRELEETRVIIDTKAVPAIIGKGSDLFNKLVSRCREVNDEMHVLINQLAESEGFQFCEQDLQNKIYRLQDIVEDLQRIFSSFEDLAESRPIHKPELPVIVVSPEIPSGSKDMSSLIAKAVAAAMKQHLAKTVAKGVPPSQAQQFNIASDGGDDPADDNDDDDDEESEEEEDPEADEEEDGREPVLPPARKRNAAPLLADQQTTTVRFREKEEVNVPAFSPGPQLVQWR
eukprot:9654995-Heterocapsa_arctica.AAC.2